MEFGCIWRNKVNFYGLVDQFHKLLVYSKKLAYQRLLYMYLMYRYIYGDLLQKLLNEKFQMFAPWIYIPFRVLYPVWGIQPVKYRLLILKSI